MSHDVVTFDVARDISRLLTASFLQAMRSTDYAAPFISQGSTVIGAFRSSIVQLFRRLVVTATVLLYRFPVVVFFNRGQPRFRNFNSAISVDVFRVKSYVDSFLDPTFAPVRVSINKRNLVRNWLVAGLVGVFRNGGGLGTGELYIPVVLFVPLLHRSPCFPDVDFAALTGNPVDHAILFSRIDGVLWSHHV